MKTVNYKLRAIFVLCAIIFGTTSIISLCVYDKFGYCLYHLILTIFFIGITLGIIFSHKIWWFFDRIWAGICYPFAIIHLKIIQFRYKWITTHNAHNQSSRKTSLLVLLQSKEEYYKAQFSAWGKFHPSFSFSENKMKRHKSWMNWLFPKKDFKEWKFLILHKYDAVTYYHNKIYNLTKGAPPNYKEEILEQLKKWDK